MNYLLNFPAVLIADGVDSVATRLIVNVALIQVFVSIVEWYLKVIPLK